MVMNLNSIRRWCFISKNDVRWTVFLTILCVWCTVCGGVSSPTTTAPTTPVSQTASEVCIIKTKASIATAMTPKQNQKCTAVTFTTTPPTTTDSTSVASSITNEASTEYPTTATVSNTMSSSMATGTESSITTDLTANAAPTTTPPSSTTTNEEATNTAVTPTTTLTSLPTTTATNAAPTTTAQSSTTEASTTTAVNLKTMPIFPEPTTAPPATENIASTEKPSSTITSEAYTTTDVTPTTTLISSEPTTVPPATENAVPTTALSSRTTTISQSITPLFTTTTKPPTATTFVTPTTMPMFSEITTFLTTTSLQNATQISVTHNPDPTAFEAQSTISLATTATSAPTLIIVTQETTMSLSMSTTDASPTTIVNPLTESGAATTQTTAVVNSTLVFNSSSPVPNEALVLSAINTLRQRRESQLNDSVKVVNVTYQKISETSYAVVFTFNLNNISMPVNSDLRGDTYQKVQNTTNNALNTLLNDPGKQLFVPKTSNFTSTSNQIDGSMGYTFQDEDVIQPVSFLNELRSQMELTTTTVSPSTISSFPSTSPSPISGSAVVTSKLLFNSSSPVPSEALVLSAINTLRQRRESQLNDSVKVVNVTYQKISETSYAVIFTFNLNNISMPVNSDLRGDTYQKVQNTTNNALNTLLNDPGKQVFVPKTSNFTSTSNQIDGSMGYTFQAEDVIQPFSFLNELGSQTVLTTASPLTTSTTSPPTVRMRRVYINIQLMFKTVGPIPSENDILQLVNSLIDPRFRTKLLSTKLSDVRFANVTFIRINDTSYSLKFGFEISNISMSEKIELRNETYVSIQTTINKLLTEILNDPSAPQFDIKQVDFNDNNTVIQANVTYVFSESNINTNSTFVKEILKINGVLTTASPLTISTSPPSLFRKVIIRISLVFKTRGTLPSESTVLQVANSLLIGLKLRTKRALTEKDLNDLVSSVNVTYTKIDDASFSLNFGFEISNVSMSEKLDLRNETYTVIENYINTFVSKILNKTTTTQFNFNNIIFNDNSSVIEANVVYVFSDSDINNFGLVSIFLATPAPTTAYPTVLNTTVPNNSTNAAWVVAIIVPVAIVLGLIPCWILLCCLLCGCCAAIRRRWHRRQSYNMQYTTRNSLF
ncbi:mucin-5AC-like isoform X8 [Ctenopharyngodon idella]|uniref:mucin-5AC-like isoform X8 n=1 Tax=Ctenopharyngodon idella TaxID=7959 RepID=UPI00222F76D3|nr:mucin-5AC-like isoform X8 [Ctenopharyngodon idella]